jgi:hypothetical protein
MQGADNMSQGLKEDIITRLSNTHSELEGVIEGLDLDLVIHTETDWRIRDILGHIATWDRVLIHAIETFLAGSEFVIPDMEGNEDDFNAIKVKEQRSLSANEILQEWNQAREEFIAAVKEIPFDRFNEELAFPWGDEMGSVALMIEYMIEHNGEHQEEILDAQK